MSRRLLDPRRIEVVDDDLAAVLRTKTPTQKASLMFSANRFIRARIAAHLFSHHPDWPEDKVQAEVARRMLGGTIGSGAPNDSNS
jgi:hypothetical protein